MTVASEASKRVYLCDGATISFAYPFKIWADGDLGVYLFTVADATTVALRLDVDYNVTNAGEESGGDVNLILDVAGPSMFVAAPSSAYKLILIRELPLIQTLDLIASGAFSAEAVEMALDRLTYHIQRLDEQFNRAYVRDMTQTGQVITDPSSLGYTLSRINLSDGYVSGNLDFGGYFIENIVGIKDNDEDTGIFVEYATDEDKVRIYTGGTKRGQFDADGLTLQNGVSVNEFSIDGALAGNSDDAVPTEKAVKTYADALTAVGAAGGILGGTFPNPGADAYIKAALYYEPDNACVLALAGYCNDPATATTFKDSSLYGNDFTITSAPPAGAGKICKLCVDLDGAADTLVITNGNYADFGDCDDISIEFWIKRDDIGVEKELWENLAGIGGCIVNAANKIVATLNVGTGAAVVTSGSAYTSTTDWYHIVMTYSSTDHVLRLYVDGVADGTDDTKSGDVDAAAGDDFYIGSDGGAADWFNGKIDGFRILRRQMSVAEILARCNAFK